MDSQNEKTDIKSDDNEFIKTTEHEKKKHLSTIRIFLILVKL